MKKFVMMAAVVGVMSLSLMGCGTTDEAGSTEETTVAVEDVTEAETEEATEAETEEETQEEATQEEATEADADLEAQTSAN